MNTLIRYDEASLSEVMVLENMWRDRVQECQFQNVLMGLYKKLPICIIYRITQMTYPNVRVLSVRPRIYPQGQTQFSRGQTPFYKITEITTLNIE